MSGPRITSGIDSQQDCQTPADFMARVREKFGPICFDLAAHAGNKQHPRYFAPREFVHTGTMEQLEKYEGKIIPLFRNKKGTRPKLNKDKEPLFEKRLLNVDPQAAGYDAFDHAWHEISKRYAIDGDPGLLWLNCEFDDIDRWAERCMAEAKAGANILLLTPLAMTKWYIESVQPVAHTIQLYGRLCFDGKNPYPKDCMLSHFHPDRQSVLAPKTPNISIWDWRNGQTICEGNWQRKVA